MRAVAAAASGARLWSRDRLPTKPQLIDASDAPAHYFRVPLASLGHLSAQAIAASCYHGQPSWCRCTGGSATNARETKITNAHEKTKRHCPHAPTVTQYCRDNTPRYLHATDSDATPGPRPPARGRNRLRKIM